MKPISKTQAAAHVFKQPLLRNTLLIIVFTVVFLPFYSFYYIFPQFNHQLSEYTEDVAIRVTTHLKRLILPENNHLTKQTFSSEVKTEVSELMQDLKIKKIKIFSSSGEVLFSSDPEDIGTKNQHNYFYKGVAAGKIISKRVQKHQSTLEGQRFENEVVETYVPLMQDNVFKGAVEVYYDITSNSEALKRLLGRLRGAILVFSMTAFLVLLLILYRASWNTLSMVMAEKTLQKAHDQLEKIVAERTRDLEKSNRSLMHEVEERETAEVSLQRSYDTQKIINMLLRKSVENTRLNDLIEDCLDALLSLPWLSFDSMGCIYLVEDDPGILVMKAQQGFSKALQETCQTIEFGNCLCGRAAARQEVIFASHVDERHDIMLSSIPDHGHYCIPLVAKGVTLGVINIYVKAGHVRNEQEEDFLKSVGNTLTSILVRHHSEQQKQNIEKRLSQSQKMEAIGTLAGGIAHDFNNILSGIFGYTQLAMMNIDTPEKAGKYIHQINEGAKRATDLIQQILTFTRQTEYEKTPIKLQLVVKEAVKFLRSSLPADIDIVENIVSQAMVKADSTQMHQIVMNLCTNAYHALKQTGGQISVSLTEVEVLDKYDLPQVEAKPGTYLMFEVRDNGSGIPHEILSHIFEPYFTTKRIGEGTGLGLAVVHGIIEEHNGYIRVESRVGKGSCFYVYLPKLNKVENEKKEETEKRQIPGGTERVMVIDDEHSILSSTSELLSDFGYIVEGFSDPEQALRAFKDSSDGFDLVITDMTMPHMTGDELIRKIIQIDRDARIILCTGYTDRLSQEEIMALGVSRYLQKPIGTQNLLFLVRQVLDE